MKLSPRLTAIEILVEWETNGLSVDLLLGKKQTFFADNRDFGLLKAIVFGVLRRYASLDWVISNFSKQPLIKLKPVVLNSLRVGVYQLLFMDRVPPSAAVNETVKALKSLKQPRYITGFVNGVLRNVERQKVELLADVDSYKMLEQARLNHPEWLLERWECRYGYAGREEICRSNNVQARLCLRVNTLKISCEGFIEMLDQENIGYSRGKYLSEAVWLQGEIGPIENLPGYRDGLFYVQDELAQLLCSLLAPFEKGLYLDACAGLGGKTAVMAQLIPEGSQIIAVEPSGQRLNLLHENIGRLGLTSIEIFEGTLQEFANQATDQYQAVLVDAPCSGLGVTGRHPDIRWTRKLEDLERYQQMQLELLKSAASLVRQGGVIVYATCSIEPEENHDVVEKFLQQVSGFRIERADSVFSGNCRSLIDEEGFLSTKPGKQVSDGFFAARLVRM